MVRAAALPASGVLSNPHLPAGPIGARDFGGLASETGSLAAT